MSLILVVEDNEDLSFGLSRSLEEAGYDVQVATDGAGAIEQASRAKPDLVVLDLMLPDMSGYDVLKKLRSARVDSPVIILTAKGAETDKLHGFRLGADDYVTKPFSVSEVLARVAVHLRRASGATAEDDARIHRFGEVVVTPSARTVTRSGAFVSLKPREYDLLLRFIERPGIVFSRQRLLKDVWGHQAEVHTRTVDMHVAELRRKLEQDPASPKHFITVWKTGYRFDP
ncbi:MAG: response regulator transcription factor [Blastocatellia bacterium]|nr:response regulator transcription factor [Blastocatellia bacterium]